MSYDDNQTTLTGRRAFVVDQQEVYRLTEEGSNIVFDSLESSDYFLAPIERVLDEITQKGTIILVPEKHGQIDTAETIMVQ